ncbi:MAG: carbohydrate-binding protein [Chitinispirillaceae bacterium]|nr:carbohydrate-binding protein [Chitinispirillaceae bacterium]
MRWCCTGGWKTWETVSCDVTGTTGKHDRYLKFFGGNRMLFHFNWWKNISAVGTIHTAAKLFEGTLMEILCANVA